MSARSLAAKPSHFFLDSHALHHAPMKPPPETVDRVHLDQPEAPNAVAEPGHLILQLEPLRLGEPAGDVQQDDHDLGGRSLGGAERVRIGRH